MGNKKTDRKRALEELTRRDILEGATSVLLTKGMAGFTIDRIAAAAGIAKGTTYLYFKNKDDLLYAVTDYAFSDLEKEYKRIAQSDSSTVEKLRMYATASLYMVTLNKVLFWELRSVMFNSIDQHVGDPDSWYWEMVDLFSETLREGVEREEMRDVDTIKMGALFLNSLNGLVMHHVLSVGSVDIEDDVNDLIDLYLNGLAFEKN